MKARLILFFGILLIFRGCASLTTPQGGPKDVIPPEMLRSMPANNSTNFKGKTVELFFDEMIKLNNPKEEILISPSVGKDIEILAKLKRVTITPKDGWKDSTTYSIALRDGVQDVTESNPAINLHLAFSTGATIDSIQIAGRIKDLLTGKPAEKITVALYTQDTFDIFTDVPNYITKTDKKGNFQLENIKQGVYGIYAFDDKNKNLKVESRTERFGVRKDKLDLKANLDSLEFGLIMLDSRPLRILAIRNLGNFSRLKFNKYITDYTLKPDTDLINSFGDDQTEVILWNPTGEDSVQLTISAIDSIANNVDSIFYVKKGDVKAKGDKFRLAITDPIVDTETSRFTTKLQYSKPVTTVNFDSIYIQVDTTSTIPIGKQDITINTKAKEILIAKDLDKKLFTANPKLTLKTGIGFLYSAENDTSKRTSSQIDISRPEDTGILLAQVETDQKNYLIQLINKDNKLTRSVENIKKYTFKGLPPELYRIRIIIDTNKNGKWDPGNVLKHLPPEEVLFYRAKDGTQSFPIRANWELGPLSIKF